MSIHIQNSLSQDDRLVPGIQIFKKISSEMLRAADIEKLAHTCSISNTTHARTHAHHCTQTVTQHVCSLNTTQTGATELFVGRLCARVEFGRIEKMLSNKLNTSYIIHTPVHILQVAPHHSLILAICDITESRNL